MTQQSLGRYRLLERIGSGGMGSVYRAEDTHLGGRLVAVKLLREDLRADPQVRTRVRKEALTLAALNHPNIATVYDFDSHEGVEFIVTELVPGRTLEQAMAEAPFERARLLHIIDQVASGLDEAHGHGIVHCDLKPSNVMLAPEDRVKILDFGVARHLRGADPNSPTMTLTRSGMIAGTPSYMAPEQFRGGAIDPRTDVFALGLLAYEMATGRRAMDEDVDAVLGTALRREKPGAVAPGIDPHWAATLTRALAFRPADRFPSAGSFAAALGEQGAIHSRRGGWGARRHVGLVLAATTLALITGLGVWVRPGGPRSAPSGCGVPAVRAVAVLPFRNLSGDANEEYFADGMTEAVINDLARIGALRVISRTSSMAYKETGKRLPEIARELDVDGILEGSVRRTADTVQVSVHLVRARPEPEQSLWTESYARTADEMPALQGGIAREVAERFRGNLTKTERSRFEGRSRVDAGAYDAYLRGRMLLTRQSEENNRAALREFEAALRTAPTFAPAWVGVAEAYYQLSNIYVPATEAIPRARHALARALELDPDLGSAHAVQSIFHAHYDFDYILAQRELDIARALEPSSAQVAFYQSIILTDLGRLDEARRAGQESLRLDPLSTFQRVGVIYLLYYQRRYDEGEKAFREFLRTEPDYSWAHTNRALCLSRLGRHEEAIGESRRAVSLGTESWHLANLGSVAAAAGRRALADSVIAELHRREATEFVSPTTIARVHAQNGEPGRALSELERGFLVRDEELAPLPIDPVFEPLHRDPRFQAFIRRMKFRKT
jgi:serine/threonine-protein kinase